MKKIIVLGIILIILGIAFDNQDKLHKLYQTYIVKIPSQISMEDKNEYYRDYDFNFVQNTTNFFPNNRQDILNIYYTVINSGKDNFTFYCPSTYTDCLDEIKNLANNQELLSHINNFVHPYNGFKHIETEYDNFGKVTIKIEKSYTEDEINAINQKITEIEASLILPNRNPIENIKAVHDYIINQSQYDYLRSDQNIIQYHSDIAYGPLIEGYGICGGYTDAMELLLEKMNIKSMKISSENHVWNALLLENQWYHLDLTWDDPVTPEHYQVLDHNFFLINTPTLIEKEKTQHIFDFNIYSEVET